MKIVLVVVVLALVALVAFNAHDVVRYLRMRNM